MVYRRIINLWYLLMACSCHSCIRTLSTLVDKSQYVKPMCPHIGTGINGYVK